MVGLALLGDIFNHFRKQSTILCTQIHAINIEPFTEINRVIEEVCGENLTLFAQEKVAYGCTGTVAAGGIARTQLGHGTVQHFLCQPP